MRVFLLLATALTFSCGGPSVFAQDVMLGTGTEEAAGENPFDGPSSAESPSAPQAPKTIKFYRAGKEVIASPESSEGETAPAPTKQNDDVFPQEETPTEPLPAENVQVPNTESGSEEPEAAVEEESPADATPEETTNEEKAPLKSAAPKGSGSLMANIVKYAQYVGVIVAVAGGLVLFVMSRKKKGGAAKPIPKDGIPQVGGPAAPVDSERIKKALAAFHSAEQPH